MDGEVFLTRDKSSGRVHKRVTLGTGLASLEGDNLDQAGEYEVIPSLDGVAPDDLCRHCFKPDYTEPHPEV